MLTIKRLTWPRLYVDCLRQAAKEGYARPSREGETIELGPAMLSCPNPLFGRLVGRGGSEDFARLEQLCYLGGKGPDVLIGVAPRYARFRETNGNWYGAYGPRLDQQLLFAVEELARRPFSRRAVALIWRESDIEQVQGMTPPKDIPCTLAINFWVGPAGDLRAHAIMRSCDLWFGLYYDMPAFAFLQRAVARALHRVLGPTFLTASSLHLYAKDVERARLVEPRLMNNSTLVNIDVPPLNTLGPGVSAGERFLRLTQWAREALYAWEVRPHDTTERQDPSTEGPAPSVRGPRRRA